VRRRTAALAILSLALLWLASGFAVASATAEPVLPSGFRDTILPFEGLTPGQGIDEPTAFRFAPGGKVFVAEKSGKVLVYDGLSDPTPALFADLRTEVYNANDRGMLGLALDPQFSLAHPYVYVLYAYDAEPGGVAPRWGKAGEDGDGCPEPPGSETDGCVIQGRLSRLTANLSTDQMVGGSEKPLVTDWCQQFSSHSVGDLQFDAEGNLWASGGEGASFTKVDWGQYGFPQVNPCGDPPAGIGGIEEPPDAEGGALRAQNPKRLSGSLIRIDPETGQGVPGNPLFSSLDANERRLVGKGFRNPFRFAIDPQTNEVYVDNVGSSIYEEIDRVVPSSSSLYNSGWPCYEGPQERELYAHRGLEVCKHLYETPGSTSAPFYYYSHESGVTPSDPCPYAEGAAISGLSFYEGGLYPDEYDGALFFADAVRGCIYVMRPGEDGRPNPLAVEPFVTEGGLYPGVDIEVGPEGDLFYASLYSDGFEPGAIHRISYDPDAPHAQLAADKEWGDAPLEAHFDASGSTDPQHEGLKYEWDLDGNGVFGAPTLATTATETYADGSKNRKAAVRVVDESGHSSVAQLTIFPGDSPPTVEIDKPGAGTRWDVGEAIHFEGAATDSEEVSGKNPLGEVPAERLYWRSRLYHCPGGPESCHAHPLQVFPAVDSGDLTAPDHDLPSHIEISLSATDARGLSAQKAVDIYPNVSFIGIRSDPPGITISAGLDTAATPFGIEAIEGSKVTVAAPEKASIGGETYVWSHWSDGGPRTHTLVASSSGNLTATYAPARSSTATTGAPPPGGKVPDSPPLRLRLSSHPKIAQTSRAARFTFSVNRPGAGFRCRLDHRRYLPCKSPQVYRGLKPGRHVFAVVATGLGGAVEGTPVKFSWRVLPPRPGGRR
jgi:glucose/arabinose dehydrogenase